MREQLTARGLAVLHAPGLDRPVERQRFLTVFERNLAAIEAGRHRPASVLWRTDPVRYAAEVEALAAARRRASLRHPITCTCDACRVRHHTARRAR
ncbi:hypothetical protein ADL32_18865 [Streptomyces albidoflavus]|uniref:hypothetical protein n=1 Tax=Streptomyces albidoflavus TaxID=1886 RepID=UPI00074400F2|nr:hypothetical protein [Streptomyces albidoflavus]KUL59634.1 hypothetical protein ADL32_18865 [Streptomyces albidoflavus]